MRDPNLKEFRIASGCYGMPNVIHPPRPAAVSDQDRSQGDQGVELLMQENLSSGSFLTRTM
jgi:hypothetical protein